MNLRRSAIILLLLTLGQLVAAKPAFASPWPGDGSEMIMADWLFFSFLAFFGVALVAFILAWRNGMLKDVEDAKYYILTIDEPDYYTPDWARTEEQQPSSEKTKIAEKSRFSPNGSHKEAT